MSLQVFISYKSEYRDFARKVKTQINQWGYGAWLDVDNIQPGDYFPDEIDKGLMSSDIMIGVMNKEALDSRPVKREWDYFLFHKDEERLLLIKQGECNPPPRFILLQHIDFIRDEAEGLRQLQTRLAKVAAEVLSSTPPITDVKPEPLPADAVVGAISDLSETAEVPLVEEEQAQKPPPPAPAKKRDETAAEEITGGLLQEKEEAKADIDWFGDDADEDAPAANAPPPPPAQAPAVVPPREPPKPAPITAPVTAPASPSPQAERGSGGEVLTSAPPQPTRQRSGSRFPIWTLGSIAALIIVVLGAAILFNFNNPDLPNNNPSTDTNPLTNNPLIYVLAVLVIGVVGVVALRRYRAAPVGTASISPATTEANRRTMLDKVEEFWIGGVLDKALEAGQFELGLAAAPGAVLRHKDYPDYPLPPNASIFQIFEDLNRELLILGEPGGGKTVLLLQLGKELIEQARSDVKKPIPIVFNLSSWAAERKPLADWLVDEMRLKYQVPKKVAKEWVEREQILPLLDGLDEVAEQYRNACVNAINAFRQQYRAVDMAVCSRIADYDLLTTKLDVRGAVMLQPLDDDQINHFLDRPDLDGLRQVMKDDDELRGMTHTPFLLNSMAYAYAGASISTLQIPMNDDMGKARRTHMFDIWVEKRLIKQLGQLFDNVERNRFSSEQSWYWMNWLAGNQIKFGQNIFHIEGLQPAWLFPVQKLLFRLILALTIGLISGLVFALTLGVQYGLIVGIFLGLLGLLMKHEIHPVDNLKFRRVKEGAIASIGNSIVAYISFIATSVFWFILVGAITIPISLIIRTESDQFGEVAVALVLILVIPKFLKDFVELNPVEDTSVRIRPNQGIWQSSINGLKVGLIVAIILMIIFWMNSIFNRDKATLSVAASFLTGMCGGLAFGGGIVVLQHLVLRLIVWRSGEAPLNYARFLDYCASAGLLRKVGGGYIFVHRYLLEYFAALE
ncbi:MAG: TIR domain-containing protein [Anaerolineae bacterium]